MSRAEQPAEERLGQISNTPNSPKHPRRRVRKRRFHIPPEALGFNIYHAPTAVSIEPPGCSETPVLPVKDPPVEPAIPAPASPAEIAEVEFRAEAERKLRVSRRGLWACLVILLLIIFRREIGWLLDQAVSAWPSINRF